MGPAAALAALLLQGATPPSAQPPGSFTRAQLRAMPPEELTRRLFGELSQIMYLLPHQLPDRASESRRFPDLPLRQLTFMTRPRGADRVGVCETDRVNVEFEPIPPSLSTPRSAGEDRPVRPRRFTPMTVYFVRDLALARQERPPEEEAERRAMDQACAGVHPRDAHIIFAASEHQAMTGVRLLADLVHAARAGRTTAPITCLDEQEAPIAEADCLRDLSRVPPDRIHVSQLIHGCGRQGRDVSCHRVELSGRASPRDEVIFEFRRGAGLTPVQIRIAPLPDLWAVTN